MKGKAAAQNANRRTKEALERVAELEAKLAEDRAAQAENVRRLSAERDTARMALLREVEARAAASIAAANRAHQEEIAAIWDDTDVRVRNVIRFFAKFVPHDEVGALSQELASYVKLPWGEVMDELGIDVRASRAGRRSSLKTHGRGCRCGCATLRTTVTVDPEGDVQWKTREVRAGAGIDVYDPGTREPLSPEFLDEA